MVGRNRTDAFGMIVFAVLVLVVAVGTLEARCSTRPIPPPVQEEELERIVTTADQFYLTGLGRCIIHDCMMNIDPKIINSEAFVAATSGLAAVLGCSIVKIVFRKKDGSYRIMMATRRGMDPYQASADRAGLSCPVVEVTTGNYRSFRWDRLVSFEVQPK